MSMLRSIGCRMGWHVWEPLVGEFAGARHTCLYCGTTKSIRTGRPPDAHDKSDIHG